MSVLGWVLTFIGGMLVGFALGYDYSARRVIRQWEEAVRGTSNEVNDKTSEREGRIK